MGKTFVKRDIKPKSEDINEWYNDVVTKAGLCEYSDTKGSLILKPNGYALWEMCQQTMDPWFKDYGVKNVYFPLLIPMKMFEKEAKHVEGFSPELAVVTHAGGEKLAEPYAIRPTSETVIGAAMSKWISSHRDLPMKLNQWCNVMRWEKRTYPFIRTSEFLWQEGHTAHSSKEDSMEMIMKSLDWYRDFYQDYAAMSPYIGIKSERERFAGADETYGIELVMPNGKALQGATSHYLGTNFSKAFEISYLDKEQNRVNVHTTSWGISTRYIGGLVLTHGDDSGLIMPPKLAPTQVVIVPINEDDSVTKVVEEIAKDLKAASVKVEVDNNFSKSLGKRINEWEMIGVPLRIEIGAKEAEAKLATIVSRLDFSKGQIGVGELGLEVPKRLDAIQDELLARAKTLKSEMTVDIETYDEFKTLMVEDKKFARVLWCEDPKCEDKVKAETTAR